MRSITFYPFRSEQEPYSVSIVLDRNYGQLLRELIEFGPVWIVESPANRESVNSTGRALQPA
jgi:hypothetical protein